MKTLSITLLFFSFVGCSNYPTNKGLNRHSPKTRVSPPQSNKTFEEITPKGIIETIYTIQTQINQSSLNRGHANKEIVETTLKNLLYYTEKFRDIQTSFQSAHSTGKITKLEWDYFLQMAIKKHTQGKLSSEEHRVFLDTLANIEPNASRQREIQTLLTEYWKLMDYITILLKKRRLGRLSQGETFILEALMSAPNMGPNVEAFNRMRDLYYKESTSNNQLAEGNNASNVENSAKLEVLGYLHSVKFMVELAKKHQQGTLSQVEQKRLAKILKDEPDKSKHPEILTFFIELNKYIKSEKFFEEEKDFLKNNKSYIDTIEILKNIISVYQEINLEQENQNLLNREEEIQVTVESTAFFYLLTFKYLAELTEKHQQGTLSQEEQTELEWFLEDEPESHHPEILAFCMEINKYIEIDKLMESIYNQPEQPPEVQI